MNARNSRALWAAAALVMFAQGCARTSVRQNPRFAEWKKSNAAVAVLPALVKLEEMGLVGHTPLPEEGKATATAVPGIVENALRLSGFSVRSSPIRPKDASDEIVLNGQFETAQQGFSGTHTLLWGSRPFRSEEDAKSADARVAPPPTLLGERAQAQALVLVDLRGWRKSAARVTAETTGEVLLAIATLGATAKGGNSSGPYGETTASVAIVDAVTGEILWANQVTKPRGMLVGKPEDAVAACLEPLTWGDQTPKTQLLRRLLFGQQ